MARVVAVARSARHGFSKSTASGIEIVAGLGVAGDAHAGETVQHLSRIKADPTQPNLRQVHLIHAELFDEMHDAGFAVKPGDLGENITTRGIALLDLPRGAVLRIGDAVALEITGLRNPCRQIEEFREGLLSQTIERRPSGDIVRKAGVMAVALSGGAVAPGDPIAIDYPRQPHETLRPV